MVLEAYHAGRAVPCPWCRAYNDVPNAIDFASLAKSQIGDESRGGVLLMLAVLSFFGCLPLAAWVWWSAQGVLGRAADDGRPGDGLVRAARIIAITGCVAQAGIVVLLLAGR